MAVHLADGVVRLRTDSDNRPLVADEDGVAVGDAAAPKDQPQLDEGLRLVDRLGPS